MPLFDNIFNININCYIFKLTQWTLPLGQWLVQSVVETWVTYATLLAIHRELPAFKTVLHVAKTIPRDWVMESIMNQSYISLFPPWSYSAQQVINFISSPPQVIALMMPFIWAWSSGSCSSTFIVCHLYLFPSQHISNIIIPLFGYLCLPTTPHPPPPPPNKKKWKLSGK